MKKTVQSFYSIWVVVQFSPLWSKWILQKETLRLNFLLNLFFFYSRFERQIKCILMCDNRVKKTFHFKNVFIDTFNFFFLYQDKFSHSHVFQSKKNNFQHFQNYVFSFHFMKKKTRHVFSWVNFFFHVSSPVSQISTRKNSHLYDIPDGYQMMKHRVK